MVRSDTRGLAQGPGHGTVHCTPAVRGQPAGRYGVAAPAGGVLAAGGCRPGFKAVLDCIKAFSKTDFTEDLKKIDVPTLIMQ